MPRSARRDATRARLLEAARAVFAERGFHGGSVEDICERAGFTRGAFYSNFASKDDLVLELYEQHAQRLIARIETLAESTDPAPGRMLAAVLDVWAQEPRAEEQWYLLQTEFTLHAIRDKAARRAWIRAQAKVRQRLAALIQRIADEQRLDLSVTPQELVRVVHSIYQGGLAQHLLEPRAVPRGSLERTLLPLVLDAVVAPR